MSKPSNLSGRGTPKPMFEDKPEEKDPDENGAEWDEDAMMEAGEL